MMHWGWDFGMGHGFSWIFMILFWTLVILVTVYLVKVLLKGGTADNQNGESAREILENRFAGGEISKAEFEDALETLRRNKDKGN